MPEPKVLSSWQCQASRNRSAGTCWACDGALRLRAGRTARGRAPLRVKRPDVIRKEEIPAYGVHSVWDTEMLPFGDDERRRD